MTNPYQTIEIGRRRTRLLELSGRYIDAEAVVYYSPITGGLTHDARLLEHSKLTSACHHDPSFLLTHSAMQV
jgi:hypothetical protein